MASRTLVIRTKMENKDFHAQIRSMESDLERLKGDYEAIANGPAYSNQTKDMQDLEKEIEQATNKLNDFKKKQEEIDSHGLTNFKGNVETANTKLTSIVKKVGRWSMAVFGVRTALSAVTSAMSLLSGDNDQLAARIEAIKYSLASALEPVIMRIVGWVETLTRYIGYLLKSWFGIDIFAKSLEHSTKKSLSNTKKMSKTLAGFDEMNVLNDNGTTGTAGATYSLKELTDEEAPEWLKKIKDYGEEIARIIFTIAGTILTIKALKVIADLINISKTLGGVFTGLSKIGQSLGLLKIAGLAITIAGIAITIGAIVDFIKNPSWENFSNILIGIGITLAGIALLTGNWIIAIVGIVAVIGGLLIKLGLQKKETLNVKSAEEKLKKVQEDLTDATNNYVDAVDNAEQAQKDLEEAEKKNKMSGEELYKQVEEGTLDYKDMTDAQKEVYKAYLNNKDAQDKLKTSTEELNTAKDNEKVATLEAQLAVDKESGSYENYKQKVIDAYQSGQISAEQARDYIEQAMGDMSDASAQTFTEDLPDDIKNGLDPDKYKSNWDKFKNKWSEFISGLKDVFKKFLNWVSGQKISGDFSVGSNYGGGGGGGSGFAKGGIVKCATGAIVNNPGKGVPVSSAIAGERGMEGIFPLTDTEQMELLGSTIGKYINLNATIPIYVGNRQIAREMKKINSINDFASNS